MRFENDYFYRFNSLKLHFFCWSVSDSDLFKIIPVLSNKKISRVQNGNLGGDSKVTNRKPVKSSWLKTLEFAEILNLRYESNNYGLQIQNELWYSNTSKCNPLKIFYEKKQNFISWNSVFNLENVAIKETRPI